MFNKISKIKCQIFQIVNKTEVEDDGKRWKWGSRYREKGK